MADVKLTDKSALTSLATGDFLHAVDVSDDASDPAGTSKKITADNVHALGDARTATLTNKEINTSGNTITVTASDVSDFDTEVGNHSDVASNTTHSSSDGSDHSFIDQDVTSGSSPTLDATNITGLGFSGFDTDVTDTMQFADGAYLDSPAVTIASNGTVITLSVEKDGGGDIRAIFSTGVYDWDCTPADTVSLTAGTDETPVLSYIYLLESNKTLTASTSGWPNSSTEYAPVATAICQSAASLQTDGAYKVHAWTDHMSSAGNNGHLSHLNHWIREQNATYVSGVAPIFSGTGTGTIGLATTAGVVLQLHDHTFPVFSDPATIYAVNDPDTAYREITNIADLQKDSTGASLTGKTYGLVFWGVVSEDTGDCKIFCNLPSGSEGLNKADKVREDKNKEINYNIPGDFKGTGFLINRLVIENNGDTTWDLDLAGTGDDLRGTFPNTSAGGATAIGSTFPDSTFRVQDDGDDTKEIAFQASGITTATTRTITMPDVNVTLATPTELTKLSGIETAADVTDSTNVNSAGAVMESDVDAKGDLLVATADDTPDRLAVGTNDHVLTADSNEASGVKWAAPASGFSDPMTTRGDLIFKNSGGTTTRLPTGTASQVLTSDGTDTSWEDATGGVDTSGTPVANDFARFTDADTIEGRSYAEVRADLSLEVGTDVQAYDAELDSLAGLTPGAEGQMITSDGLGDYQTSSVGDVRGYLNVEDGADETDTANVTSAGALMDSEVDVDIKTLALPASTTISTFGASLVDDAAASNARTTLDVDQAGTDNSTDITLGTASGLSLSTQELSLAVADTDTTGALSDTDWDTFNNKGDMDDVVDDTSPQLGGDLDLNDQNIQLKLEPGSDHTSSGIIISATVDANATGIGAALHVAADGHYEEADADSVTTAPCTATALETGTGTKKVLLQGIMRDDTWNWTTGPGEAGLVFLSTTTGAFTQTAPSGTGDVIQVVGNALSDDVLYFNPQLHMIEHT